MNAPTEKSASPSPAALGYRRPAEWEPHGATWLAWPHNRSDWPCTFNAIPWVFGEMTRHLIGGEKVRILVNDAAHEARARRVLAALGLPFGEIEFFACPTDRGWTRDAGPIFLRRGGPEPGLAVADFHFNAWARYRNYRRDRAVAGFAAQRLGLPLLDIRRGGREVVLEGGAVDVNGAGTALATEECLLDPRVQVRNRGFGRGDYEALLRETLGARNVVWLGRGIAGDDTHGHVDDVCRFANRTTVVLAREDDPRDENYAPLRENRERLENARLEDGSKIEVVELPMPAPVRIGGERCPAGYANFYIANAAVLVPTFNDPNDRAALGILGELFPDRRVVGIHARELIEGQGAIHCLTQEQPEG